MSEETHNEGYNLSIFGEGYREKVEIDINLITKWMELGDLSKQCDTDNFALYYNALLELIVEYKRLKQMPAELAEKLESLTKEIREIVEKRYQLIAINKKHKDLNQLMIRIHEIGDDVLELFDPEKDVPYKPDTQFEKLLEVGLPISEFLTARFGEIAAWLDTKIHRIPDQPTLPEALEAQKEKEEWNDMAVGATIAPFIESGLRLRDYLNQLFKNRFPDK